MDLNLLGLLVDNLEAAGAIGGYVSISIIGVGLITFALKGRISENNQIGPRWAHPIIGGLMGIIPGCGATIVVSSMYRKKNITFGGLLAAFIVTMGEGSFVLLGASDEADVAANLKAFVIVNIVAITLAILLGTVLDAVGFRKTKTKAPPAGRNLVSTNPVHGHVLANFFVEKAGFYLILAMAIFLLPGSIMALWGGQITALAGISAWVTTALTLLCIVYYLVFRFAYHGHCCTIGDDLKHEMHNAVADVAMVVLFVFIGLFVANFAIDVLVGPERFDAWMTSSTGLLVLIAALIGLMPGCGGMITVAVAYTVIPNFPLPALIAAAIATSGDGVFPLLASDRKDAIFVSGLGFLAAIIVGYGALAIGI